MGESATRNQSRMGARTANVGAWLRETQQPSPALPPGPGALEPWSPELGPIESTRAKEAKAHGQTATSRDKLTLVAPSRVEQDYLTYFVLVVDR